MISVEVYMNLDSLRLTLIIVLRRILEMNLGILFGNYFGNLKFQIGFVLLSN